LTLQLAQRLKAAGNGVVVITNRHPPNLPAVDEVEGISVLRQDFPSPRAAVGPALRFPATFTSSVVSLLREAPRPDLVNVHCASAQLATGAAFSKIRGVPLVLSTHGEVEGDANDIFDHSAYLRMVFRIATRSAAALTACSRWAADSAARLAPPFAAATVIPNGVNPTQWEVTALPEEPIVAAWGRHVRTKGFDLLLETWPRVREFLPTAQLLIGGTGPETPALRSMADDSVTFLGILDRPAVQQLLNRSRVVAIPSRIEPFGIVAVEAMATGRAVVWSIHGGLDEATDGLRWPVDPTDRETFARTLVAALRSSPEPDRYRHRAEALRWEVVADRYLDLYNDVLGTYRSRQTRRIRR
jgi:glycogen(starch) synthase